MRDADTATTMDANLSGRERELGVALNQGQSSERALMEMLARMASRREDRVIYSSYPACGSDS